MISNFNLNPGYITFWAVMFIPFFLMFITFTWQMILLLKEMKREREILNKVLIEMIVIVRLIRP